MESDNDTNDWLTDLTTAVSGSPGFTLVAGMVAGILANVILRARPSGLPPVASMATALTKGPCKMVLVVRTDIGMGKGKVAAQCSHAAVMCYKKALKEAPELVERWEGLGVTKVCLKVDSEEGLLSLASQAREAGLVHGVVRDAGRTQISAGTMTVLGIGPAPLDILNQITGHLKLY